MFQAPSLLTGPTLGELSLIKTWQLPEAARRLVQAQERGSCLRLTTYFL